MAKDLTSELASIKKRATEAWRAGGALPVLNPALRWGGDEPRGDHEHLRIGLVTDTYLPVANGVTHLIGSLARTLAALGHEPHIFTFTGPGAVRASQRDHDNVRVHLAGALPISRSGYYFGVRYPLHMKRALREMDIVHVHHPFISGRLVWRLLRPEQPVIFTNHTRYDIYGHYVQQWMPFVPEDIVQDRLTNSAARFANRCDAVISPSLSAADVLRGWGVTVPIDAIANGIDLERFHRARAAVTANPKLRLKFRERFRLPADAAVAVYLGRLTQEKNVEALIKAFCRITGGGTKRLLIIGEGPSATELKTLVRQLGATDLVRFVGALPYDEVPAALACCDIFASASVSEVHPLTFIEAMAVGLPCVGLSSPGVTDTVDDRVNGWLSDDAQSLTQVLAYALDHACERSRAAEAAFRDSKQYSIENTALRTLALYREVLSGRRDRALQPKNVAAATAQE